MLLEHLFAEFGLKYSVSDSELRLSKNGKFSA